MPMTVEYKNEPFKELPINPTQQIKNIILWSKRNQEVRKLFEIHDYKVSLSWHLKERIDKIKAEGNHRNITYFFVSKDNASVHEQGCLEREASQVVIILKMYMVPLNNKCCAYKPHRNGRNATRITYQSIPMGAFTKTCN